MARSTTEGPTSSWVEDASRMQRQQNTPQVSPAHPRPIMPPFSRDGPHDSSANGSFQLPPLRHPSRTPPTPSSDRKSGTSLGVHSILNPQADVNEHQRNRPQQMSQMESPSPIESQPSRSLPSISRPTSVDSTQDEPVPPRPFQPPGRPSGRPKFSPRSPSLHRTPSLGMHQPPTGTIDAHQSPFLTASTRPTDPVTSQPSVSTPPTGGRPSYFPPAPPTAPTPPPHMVHSEIRRPSMSFPQSGSASPIASYSPYSQPASVASSQFDSGSAPGAYPNASGKTRPHDAHESASNAEHERMIHMAPSSQSSIQIMTIKSQAGHHVQIPVDVQAASKVADDKRKRNAGASARFRARRKEKEREASQSITRLEQQLRDAAEDIDYYRNERDYFKSIVFQQPGAERHYARPPSPRLRRMSAAPSTAPSISTGGGSRSPYSDYDDDAQESERNVRRRTSTYHPVSGSAPTQPNGSFASYSMHQPPAPGIAPSRPVQAQQVHSREQRQLPEFQRPSSERPAYHDPFAADPARFDNRSSWAPRPGQSHESRA